MGDTVLHCPAKSDTGAYRIPWEGPAPGGAYRLEENGKTVYEGPDVATTVTGRGAGEYEYRVALLGDGAVSSLSVPCTVHVHPPAMSTAFGFLAAGFLVFAATTAVVVRGHRAHRSGAIG